MTQGGYQEIDHTADTGLRITGETLEELFLQAAEGMFALIRPGNNPLTEEESKKSKSRTRKISLTSPDRESLLKDWLAELLYHHSTDHLYFTGFTIHSIGENHLDAVATGVPITDETVSAFMDIKAVTYHGLEVRETDEGYEATVIFDI